MYLLRAGVILKIASFYALAMTSQLDNRDVGYTPVVSEFKVYKGTS